MARSRTVPAVATPDTPPPAPRAQRRPNGRDAGRKAARWLDVGILAGSLGLAFALGAFRMRDTDFWWHLKTGDLIRQTWRFPVADWYTFGAAGHAWIDLHWLFQVLLSWGYERGGVPVLNLAKCAITCAALAVLLVPMRRDAPLWVAALAWLPALFVLGGRMYVRPETLTLLYLAIFLAIGARLPDRPRLAWVLPAVMVLWVNTQGLFVLGYFVLGCALVDASLRPGAFGKARRRWWRTIAAAGVATLAASVLNPYGLLGATFPIQLARTMNSETFGRSIAELMPVALFIKQMGWRHLPLQLHLLTFALGAASFALPALWRIAIWVREGRTAIPAPPARRRRSRAAGGEATARVGWRPSVYRLLLFAAFGALGFKATRNTHQFAAAVGAVTAWNLADWAAAWRARREAQAQPPTFGAVLPRLATLACLAGAILLVGSGTYYAWAGEGRTIGLGEEPLWYPHAAVEAAGGPGMPERAVCFHNGHAALYEYRWGPDRKVFADARLEVIGPVVYEEYLTLQRQIASQAPGWEAALAAMGQPAVLVDLVQVGNGDMAATLLAAYGWRCVWFDAVAAVFAPPTATGAAPSIDFAARHYHPDPATEPKGRAAWLATARALAGVSLVLQGRGRGELARPMVLLGLDYARRSRDAQPDDFAAWKLVGQLLGTFDLIGTPEQPSRRYASPFDPVFDLPPARAVFGLQEARRRGPDDTRTLLTLGIVLQSAGLYEEALPVWSRLTTLDPPQISRPNRLQAQAEARRQEAQARQALGEEPSTAWRNRAELEEAVEKLLRTGRARSAADLLERAHPPRSRSWEVADRLATLRLHAGQPAEARAVWQAFASPSSAERVRALASSRIGMTHLVTDEFDSAIHWFRDAARIEPRLFEAWYGLAIAEQDAGRAAGAAEAARRAVELAPNSVAREAARTVLKLASG